MFKRFIGTLHPVGATLLPSLLLAMVAVNAAAKPGEGIRAGPLVISPFLDVSATYDSNVFLLEENELDDVYWDFLGGLGFVNKTTAVTLRGRGWGLVRRYTDYSQEDREDWGERVELTFGTRDTLQVNLNQKYRKTADYDRTPGATDYSSAEGQDLILSEDRTMRVQRQMNDLGLQLGRDLTDRIQADVAYTYSWVDYEMTNLYDWVEHKLAGNAAFRMTDKLYAHLIGQVGRQISDGYSQDGDLLVLRLGLSHQATEKLTFSLSGGYEWYSFSGTPQFTTNTGRETFSFDVATEWRPTDRWTFQLSGRNGIQPAAQYQDNAIQVTLGSLGVLYKMGRATWLSLTGSYRYDDYDDPTEVNGVPTQAYSRQLAGHARITYSPPRKFYNIYAEARYEDTDSTWKTYEQLRLSLAAAVRY